MTLVIEIYHLTEKFPREELDDLTSQLQKAVTSLPSNIAERKIEGLSQGISAISLKCL